MSFLLTQNMDISDIMTFLEILGTVSVLSIIVMLLINTKEIFYMNFSENN